MALLEFLKARIASEGPISVAGYMEAALTHPEFGYYMTRDPFGGAGDFTTAPEISQIFGEVLGAWIAAQWQAAGAPAPCVLLELGPGRGTLMRDCLRATRNAPGFHDALHIVLLEASPALCATQQKNLRDAHPRLRWVKDLSALPNLPIFFLANEFFDALPIRQFLGSAERKIAWREDRLYFTHDAIDRETCEPAQSIMHSLAAHITAHGGAGLVVDYGYSGGSREDTLQAVKNHAYAGVLDAPGEADITAHVDFSALAEAAREAGAAAHGPMAQGALLRRLGAELRASALCKGKPRAEQEAILAGLERVMSPAQMGELFKTLAVTPLSTPVPEGFA